MVGGNSARVSLKSFARGELCGKQRPPFDGIAAAEYGKTREWAVSAENTLLRSGSQRPDCLVLDLAGEGKLRIAANNSHQAFFWRLVFRGSLHLVAQPGHCRARPR